MAIAAVGVGAMLGLSAMLSFGFVNARQDDGKLLAQTQTACRAPSDAVAAARIGWLARCGRTIEQLEVARAETGLGFGLRRADSDIERMKEQVLRDFSNLILAPYDQNIETDLARNQAGLEHLLAVSQRLRMLDHCRRQSDACQQEAATNLAFDQDARLFSPFVSGEQDARADREHAAALLTTYMGYLRWQQSATLDAEAQRLRALLARLLAAHTTRPEDVRAWADQRRDPIALTGFWLPPDRVVGVEAAAMPAVSAAFTRQAWQEVLAPMLRTAMEAVPSASLSWKRSEPSTSASTFAHGDVSRPGSSKAPGCGVPSSTPWASARERPRIRTSCWPPPPIASCRGWTSRCPWVRAGPGHGPAPRTIGWAPGGPWADSWSIP